MWNEEYEKLSSYEKGEFRRLSNYLLSHTYDGFILLLFGHILGAVNALDLPAVGVLQQVERGADPQNAA